MEGDPLNYDVQEVMSALPASPLFPCNRQNYEMAPKIPDPEYTYLLPVI